MVSGKDINNRKVLVLHQNDELKIISLQNSIQDFIKKTLGKLQCIKVFPVYPLWGVMEEPPTEDSKVFLKNVVELNAGSLFIKGNSVFLSVLLTVVNAGSEIKVFTVNFEILRVTGSFMQNLSVSEILNSIDLSDFETKMSFKIFRIAEAHFNEQNREYFLTDSEWKKIC